MILDYEKQFASPELCKRLWELGVDTGTAMQWIRASFSIPFIDIDRFGLRSARTDTVFGYCEMDSPVSMAGVSHYCCEIYPAYSVAELGELLKPYSHDYSSRVKAWWWGDAGYWNTVRDMTQYLTEADARAALLIRILEDKQAEG